MAKIKMSGCVIFGLFFFALFRCGSTCSSKTKAPITNPTVKPEPESDDYDTNPTISGGIRVDPSDPIPWQLSIRYLKPEDGIWYHICGGVILDKRTAITAAHCFENSTDESRYCIVAGENLLSFPEYNEQILHLKKLIIHPNYTDFRNGSDIAILHVDKFEFNNYTRPVLISSVSNEQLSNLNGVISGWGVVSHDSGASNFLQKGIVSILSSQDCLYRLTHKMRVGVREGIVCAKSPTTRTCTGDSGGPLVIQNYKDGGSTGNLLVGITSFGPKNCSRQNSAGAFTEISHFYKWIQANRDPPQLPQSCSDAMEISPSSGSKNQRIFPHGNNKSLEVLCDFETDGGGWTVIQKRSSGPKHEFNQTWIEYLRGFGSLDNNFWLGLENIHALTQNGDQELRIEMEDFEGEKKYAKYSSFSISDDSDFYRLTIGGFSGDSTLNDSMTYHNGQRFSTIDKDNDFTPYANCAVELGGGGGWWFNQCSNSNLNGLYFEKGEKVPGSQGIFWESWKGGYYSHAKTEMKIRKRKP